MTVFLPETNDEYELAPAGTHTARCYQVIDLGTQETHYDGILGHSHQIRIAWELVDELMKDGRPFTVSRNYTWTMSPKGNLRQDLEAWRGQPFTDADLRGANRFNVKKLIGVGATLTIIHTDARDGAKQYANVKAVGGLMKGVVLPPPVNKPVYLWLERDTFDDDAFDNLYPKLKDKIAKSPEFLKITKGVEMPRLPSDDDMDQEIPF